MESSRKNVSSFQHGRFYGDYRQVSEAVTREVTQTTGKMLSSLLTLSIFNLPIAFLRGHNFIFERRTGHSCGRICLLLLICTHIYMKQKLAKSLEPFSVSGNEQS